MTDPRDFAPVNLGAIFAQAQEARGRQQDREFRLGELMRRQQEQEAERSRAVQERQREALTRIAPVVAQRPYGQRRAFIQSIAPQLRQFDITDEQIMSFDPTDDNLSALTALGGGREQAPTNIEREVAYYRSIGRPDLAETRLRNHAEGAPVLFDINGDGAPDLVPRSHFNQPQQAAPAGEIPDGTVIENDAGVRLIRRGGRWVPAGGAGSQAQTPFNPSAIPANFTSGRRTPEGNRLVGGVPNSAHLTGDAADFAPRPGQTMRQLEADLRRRFPNARVINEGDHVHIQQRGLNAPYHGRRGTTGLRGS